MGFLVWTPKKSNRGRTLTVLLSPTHRCYRHGGTGDDNDMKKDWKKRLWNYLHCRSYRRKSTPLTITSKPPPLVQEKIIHHIIALWSTIYIYNRSVNCVTDVLERRVGNQRASHNSYLCQRINYTRNCAWDDHRHSNGGAGVQRAPIVFLYSKSSFCLKGNRIPNIP